MHTDLVHATPSARRFATASRPSPSLQRRRDEAAADSLAEIRALANDSDRPDEVRRMAEYIAEYLFDPQLDFAGIIASAQRRDLDIGTIAGRFAEHAGQPPMRFVEQHRHRVADALLARVDLSAAEATTLAGFPSFAAFGRAASQSSTTRDHRDLIAAHWRAARGSTADIEAILGYLACELSGPDLHALIAHLLERFALVEENRSSP